MHAPHNQLDVTRDGKRRSRKALPKGKWIEGTSADVPYGDAARAALRARLELVWFYLKPAAKEADEDIEYVHQLRVATRRAMATLEMFDDLLPRRRGRWMRKQLRRVRRAAGTARDCDVMLERFGADPDSPTAQALEPLLDRLRQQRVEAQAPIEDIYARLKQHDYPTRVQKLLKRVRLRESGENGAPHRFGDVARCKLRPAVEAFFAAASADLNDVSLLHQLRIEGKHLRYSMEILAGAFPPSFRGELYPQIEELQSHLGEINDHATASRWFQEWTAQSDDVDLRTSLANLTAQEESALAEGRDGFLSLWTHKRAIELQTAFDQLLASQAEKQPD